MVDTHIYKDALHMLWKEVVSTTPQLDEELTKMVSSLFMEGTSDSLALAARFVTLFQKIGFPFNPLESYLRLMQKYSANNQVCNIILNLSNLLQVRQHCEYSRKIYSIFAKHLQSRSLPRNSICHEIKSI